MSHSSSFDITTARGFLHTVVIPEHEDFVADNASERHALLTTIVAYHMYEWVNGRKFSGQHFNTTYPTDARLADMFELARNITNGTKHFISTAQTRTQGGCASDFSDEFERPLVVQLPDGSETSADIFLRALVDFWKAQESNGAF